LRPQDRSPSRAWRWIDARILRHSTTRPWNVLANVASILGLILTTFSVVRWNVQAIPILYLCLLSFFLVVRYVRQERWARYAEGAVVLEKAYSLCQEAAEVILWNQHNVDMFMQKLQDSLDAFGQAFTLVVGSSCRVCLAELTVSATSSGSTPPTPDEVFLVQVILRGDKRTNDQLEKAQRVAENTDFLQVLQTGKPFLHNDLIHAYKLRKYDNSKWSQEMLENGDFPYTSTIVWPIRLSERPLSGAANPPLAFLCVDTKRRDAFWSSSDVPLGACYAHAIYPLVRTLIGPA